jgi:hypothetical protein
MRSSILAAAIVMFLLTSCETPPNKPTEQTGTQTGLPNFLRPQVFVVDGARLAVSPEPLIFKRNQGAVRIVWQLPADSPFEFTSDGITIDGRVTKLTQQDAERFPIRSSDGRKLLGLLAIERGDFGVKCHREAGGKAFACVNPNETEGTYAYTIRVRDPSNQKTITLDPTFVNDK